MKMISANIPINPLVGYSYYQSVSAHYKKHASHQPTIVKSNPDHGPAAIVDLSEWASDVLQDMTAESKR